MDRDFHHPRLCVHGDRIREFHPRLPRCTTQPLPHTLQEEPKTEEPKVEEPSPEIPKPEPKKVLVPLAPKDEPKEVITPFLLLHSIKTIETDILHDPIMRGFLAHATILGSQVRGM